MPGDGWRTFRGFLSRGGPAPRPPALPKFAVLVAHPDDETIGAGALLGRLAPAAVIHATDGAPRDLAWAPAAKGDRDGYARARRRELEGALSLAGVEKDRLFGLGFVDQEVALALPELSEQLAELFLETAPDLVLTLAYEGGHPDHDAVAFAAHAAIELLRRRGRSGVELAEMGLYHAGAGGGMVAGEFLPSPPAPLPAPLSDRPGEGSEACRGEPPLSLFLTPSEVERKRRMIAAFATQEETLRPFLPERPERFRPAPACRFTEPPHPGPLQYEIWGFPMTGEAWRQHARRALRALDLPEDSPL